MPTKKKVTTKTKSRDDGILIRVSMDALQCAAESSIRYGIEDEKIFDIRILKKQIKEYMKTSPEFKRILASAITEEIKTKNAQEVLTDLVHKMVTACLKDPEVKKVTRSEVAKAVKLSQKKKG